MNKEDLEDAIMNANADKDIDGIMVYFPVFGDRQVYILNNGRFRLILGLLFTAMYVYGSHD